MSYKNFELLSNDIISLAKEIMPDKVIYINFLNDEVQVTMKVSRHDTKVNVFEGDEIPVENAVCNNIDYENEKPLILEDIKIRDFEILYGLTTIRFNSRYINTWIKYIKK